jgi:hypothetical protein
MYKTRTLVILLLIIIKISSAQWTGFSLPGNNIGSIHAIAIDSYGNKWCGTYKGAFKFDGVSFTKYDTANSGIASNVISSIATEGQDIWFATDKGISKFNGSAWTTYNTSNSPLLSNSIYSVAVSPQGSKWFGGVGIYELSGNTWTIYDTTRYAGELPHIGAITIDAQDNKWMRYSYEVGNPYINGIDKYDGTNWTRYSTADVGVSICWAGTITTDAFGNLWCGVGDVGMIVGLYKFDGVTWADSTAHFSLDERVWSVAKYGQGLLVGVNLPANGFYGLHYLENGIWTKELLDNSVSSIAIDAQGKRWIGSWNTLFTDAVSVDIKDINSKEIIAYPNPFNNCLNFERPLSSINIYNLLGEKVLFFENGDMQQIDLGNLNPGSYIIEGKLNNMPIREYIIKQ